MSSFFITGSGTDVGKTYITRELINRASSLKIKIDAIKPIISGFNMKQFDFSDTGILLKALKKEKNITNIENTSPWRFKHSLSPDMASRIDKKDINFSKVVHFCKHRISDAQKFNKILLIEGVGGIMVPINNNYTILDLIKKLDISVIFVTRNYLGSLSHTLTALKVLKTNNIKINSIIINQESKNGVNIDETKISLAKHTKNIPIYLFKLRKKALSSQLDDLIETM